MEGGRAMKRIISILIIVLVLPSYCLACPLCSPIPGKSGDTPDCFFRHINKECDYDFSNVGQPFKDLMNAAIDEWQAYASISMTEGGSEWCIMWEDNSTPTQYPGSTTTTINTTTGDITCVVTTFYANLDGYYWTWDITCDGVPPAYSLYKCMLHEAGHALGFCIAGYKEHPSSGSVMQQGGCYTGLEQDTDGLCAIFLYQADPVSRCEQFTPVRSGGGVAIKWITEYEYNTASFRLEKQHSDGSFISICDEIIPAGSATDGAEYEYFDPTGKLSDIYRLVEVDEDGIILGTAIEKVLPEEPVRRSPIVLSETEREKLYSDICSMINAQPAVKDEPLKAPLVGNTEWLAIYPAAFSSAIAPLITYRDLHLYNASGITYEDIQAQYGTIKAYLQYLWSSQSQSLIYVVIVGDDDLIPAERCTDGDVGAFYANYFTDVITADLTGDWLPEVSVGRIPASSSDEVALYVAKTLEYEGQASADWNKDITFLVDDRDGGFGYQSGSVATMFAQRLAEYIPVTHTLHYKSMLASLPYDQCSQRTEVISEFDAGRGLVLAFGAKAGKFSLTDWVRTHDYYTGCAFSGTQLAQNSKYAFILGSSCDIGDMTATTYPWILKELLFQRYSGAIGGFAPSGSTWQSANYNIAEDIFYYLYSYGVPSLGIACNLAQKNEMEHDIPGNAHTARSYIFYGDPAIRLKGSHYNSPPVVTISSPSFGDYYQTGQTITINWHVVDEYLEGTRTTIQRRVSPILWEPIRTNLTVNSQGYGTYIYRVPAYPTPWTDYHAAIKVFTRDIQNEEGSATTGDFTIEYLSKPDDEPIPHWVDAAVLTTRIEKPFPNPFNPNTTIRFALKETVPVELAIFDTGGRRVKTFYTGEMLARGIYTMPWDGRNESGFPVSSGIYFLRFIAGDYSRTDKLILLR